METFLVIFLGSFVCCCLLLNHCWGIIMDLRVFSRASQGGSTTTTLTTRGLCPDGSVVLAGPKFVGLADYSEGPE